MKHILRTSSILLCMFTLFINGAARQISPYFSIRSQGANAARELAGWTNHVNLFGVDRFYSTGSLTTEYTKSFHSLNIAQCLFGDDLLGTDANCRSIKISGSGVENRNSTKDWLADYFGLPRDYQSTLSICPRIENFIADFNFYLGFDNIVEGMFLRFHVPVTYTKWSLNFSECINNPGSMNHQPGYFNGRVTLGTVEQRDNKDSYPNIYGVARSNLVTDFTSYACNRAVPNLGTTTQSSPLPSGDATTTNATFPAVFFDPLCNARFVSDSCNDISKIGVADIDIILGWNAFQDDNYHLGFGFRVTAPTGNVPDGQTVFEPIIGNGRHWGIGAHITSHALLWSNEDRFQSISLFVDANISHLLKTRQVRTFDLKNKANSRYMLAQKMGPVDGLIAGSPSAGASPTTVNTPVAEFARVFTPVANLTTLPVDVSVGIQADIVFMFTYQRGDFTWDLGYNLWLRNCEKITIDCQCSTAFADGKTWVLKGDGQVYGYADATTGNVGGIALSASQSSATIHGGTNGYTSTDTKSGSLSLRPTRNPGVDNSEYAINSEVPSQIITDNPNITNDCAGLQIKTSINPIFIRECDIDIESARTKGLSHKVFTHINYTWVEYKEHWDPYLGAGAEGEFHSNEKACKLDCLNSTVLTNECDTPCNRCGLSQWGVWLKGGISFD